MAHLLQAAIDRDVAAVRGILEDDLTIINYQNELGYSALHLAAEARDVQIVAFLVDHRVIDIDGMDKMGWTPLNLACLKAEIEIASILLKRGANVRQANQFGATPLDSAIASGNVEVVTLLLENGAIGLINTRNEAGASPLMAAVAYGWEDIVIVLLNAGASLVLRNNNGQTAEDMANTNSAIERTLREATCSIRTQAEAAMRASLFHEARVLYARIVPEYGGQDATDLMHRAIAALYTGATDALVYRDANASYNLGKTNVFESMGDMLLLDNRVGLAKRAFVMGSHRRDACQVALQRIHEEEVATMLFSEPFQAIQAKLAQDDELGHWMQHDPTFALALANVYEYGYTMYYHDPRLQKATAVLKMYRALDALIDGKTRSAWSDATASFDLGKTDVYATMGDILLHLGRVKDAAVAYSKGAEVYSAFYDIRCFVGLAHIGLAHIHYWTPQPIDPKGDEIDQVIVDDRRLRSDPDTAADGSEQHSASDAESMEEPEQELGAFYRGCLLD
ncbi:Aste57867_11725 [Aphanomyces stellatus]|uniref:Aste57867_11725 protein n=1 Tax=Aphanomyces stellatus TaxID=120398 RepID=A0A485KU06_9STRA|nr:hypothetical protein As57867_011681 [Aphanomyces stellatus]VFT88582.1 Aste57867_11725 [Aphanomyces stellatus]